ncbi:PAS domain-containing protein [Paenarthrobacter sp. DKR-5]|uniref:sensor histidine kinase n=1 Tax=Paenarthrobacter sp. DKR-5 TaxID=2835535 RepID=UPI001BDC385B|nr:ATP-binding protein [Paenarthrobacter sp. DKR-5]MBT1004349.1 PAS domain-containing protein [Paenarthrobacter sp. DKR-5]
MDALTSLFPIRTSLARELSLRGRVVLSQLPLCVTALLLAAGAALFHEHLLGNPHFITGILLTVVLLLVCAAVPWEKLPFPSFLLIPVLDFVPVGLIRFGADNDLQGLGLLAIFPVIWLAASGLYRRASIAVATLATLVMAWAPVFAAGGGISAKSLSRPLLLPFMALAIGVTVSAMTHRLLTQQAMVQSQGARLQDLLLASGRRERLLDAVVEAVDVGVVAVDSAGSDVLANRKQREFDRIARPAGASYPPDQDWLVVGSDGLTPVPPERRPRARAMRGESFSDYLVWIGPEGSRRVLSTSARPLTDSHGGREGAVVTYNDVTELVKARNAKDDFVANVTHELRTPLTSILGYVELLSMDEALDPQVGEGLKVIARNSERLLVLVNDLLTAVVPPTGIRPAPADLAESVRISAAAAEPAAERNGVVLRTRLDDPLPGRFDAERIGQVLDNLLSNAVKYSPGGGTVTVSAERSGPLLVCSVSDEGMGMTDDEASDVFTRFFRGAGARKAAIPGIGLGLSIAKGIVEDHGGRISCRSESGRGTTMTFTLPA